jgi:hypothetical protein
VQLGLHRPQVPGHLGYSSSRPGMSPRLFHSSQLFSMRGIDLESFAHPSGSRLSVPQRVVGDIDGLVEGASEVGALLGPAEGVAEGESVGRSEGLAEGSFVEAVGAMVGTSVMTTRHFLHFRRHRSARKAHDPSLLHESRSLFW